MKKFDKKESREKKKKVRALRGADTNSLPLEKTSEEKEILKSEKNLSIKGGYSERNR
jgi:hypothetical protein